ncbi:protein arginine kinase [Clostridium manihotivorum]|uniref:Protein-arginine kinase n=1 Tax=Clostridium manihotivorum TaxID=2320868 RepID=A0A3R5QRN5_9CLOT|nr:protein arginine kinase [Clostridium manihotivorum]QAA30772.1 protein arginine kinase [Clostridium manihotivorum]
MDNWINGAEAGNDEIVISSRVRLARNLKKIPFTNRMDESAGRENVDRIEGAFYLNQENREKFTTIRLWESNGNVSTSYFEKHLISPNLLKSYKKTAFLVDKDETMSIMINEEDHIRLQCITKGFNVREAYNEANKLDDMLEQYLDYAFDEKFGYLTACPTNLGTGMRASVMIHLPALTMNKEIDGLIKGLAQVGMTIRGLYGEGSNADSNIYQISNQVTLGVTEEEIITNLQAVVSQVVAQEIKSRESLRANYEYEILDKIYRSIGILKNAIILSSKECLELLSYVRLGVEMSIINDVDKKLLNSLLVSIQPASLQLKVGRKLSERERDVERGKLVREAFRKINN